MDRPEKRRDIPGMLEEPEEIINMIYIYIYIYHEEGPRVIWQDGGMPGLHE